MGRTWAWASAGGSAWPWAFRAFRRVSAQAPTSRFSATRATRRSEGGSSKAATAAMANLAEAIQGLVKHMRTEQQMIRDWADAQAEQQRDIKLLLERLGREDARQR